MTVAAVDHLRRGAAQVVKLAPVAVDGRPGSRACANLENLRAGSAIW